MCENKEMRPFGVKDKFSYMMGDFGCNAVLNLANSYLLIFYTKVMGVSGAVVGTIFMLARFVDAFTDMGMGRIVDTHANKKGERFRPWIAYGSIPLLITNCLMYNYWIADASEGFKNAWLVVTYILFGSISYTVVNIPYGAMSNVITDDAGERASLSTWRNVGAQLAGVALGIMIPMLVYVKDANGNDMASGSRFFMTSVILGVVAVVSLYICYKGSVERIQIADKTEEKKGNKAGAKVIVDCFKDSVLLKYFGFNICVYAATQVFMTFNQFIFLDYFGNTSLSGLASFVLFLGMMLSAPFASSLSKKYGKKELSVIGLAISSVGYGIMWFAHIESVVVYLIVVFIAFFGLGLVTMVSYALMNDCIDNHFLVSGDRVEGTVYAMASFVRKMAGAICTGLGGWGLALISYDETAVVQTQAVKDGIYNLSVGLPTVCFIGALVCMIVFPLSKKRVEENTNKLAKMRK